VSKIPTDLGRSLGKSIRQLCPFSIAKMDNQNHCAHYVSHMMGYEFPGPTCKNFTWADKQKPAKGATIRVDDIFKQCVTTELLAAKPAAVTECLVFVTLANNVKKVGSKLVMGNNPKKHLSSIREI